MYTIQRYKIVLMVNKKENKQKEKLSNHSITKINKSILISIKKTCFQFKGDQKIKIKRKDAIRTIKVIVLRSLIKGRQSKANQN